MNITFDDLCLKIGRLVLENDLLMRRIQELEEQIRSNTTEIAQLNKSIADCPVKCGSQTPSVVEVS